MDNTTLGRRIRLYQGDLKSLPPLLVGEPACTIDAKGQRQLWVGSEKGNVLLQAEQHVIDNLISNDNTASLSAKQGKILKDLIDALGDGSGIQIADDLTTNSPLVVLSARQGMILNQKIEDGINAPFQDHINNITGNKHLEPVTAVPDDLTNKGYLMLRKNANTEDTPDQPFQEVRQTQNLISGSNIVNSATPTPTNIEIMGSTLVSLGNTPLEDGKKYVLSSPHYKLKMSEQEILTGVSKFTVKPNNILTTFKGKIAGSLTVNPNIARLRTGEGFISPVSFVTEFTQPRYTDISDLNAVSTPINTLETGKMAQALFSFDVIKAVEKVYGTIPGSNIADKVKWIKTNVFQFRSSWFGFGNNQDGNKATFTLWDGAKWINSGTSPWGSHTESKPTRIGSVRAPLEVDINGYIHYLAYAEPSNGTVASSIHTDYIELTIILNEDARPELNPSIIKIANFEGKISGSTVENPNIAKRLGIGTTLYSPDKFTVELDGSQSSTGYYRLEYLDALYSGQGTSTAGTFSQQLFTFNLIEEVERNIGSIPRTALNGKVQWLKDNINKLTGNWYGFGSSSKGNKAMLSNWRADVKQWTEPNSHTTASTAKLAFAINPTIVPFRIDDNGMVHFIAYTEVSDGVVVSEINTNYIELEIELKSRPEIYNPKVPLYEISQAEYDKILVEWSENDVINRYPSVQGIQHLTNPYLSTNNGTLVKPFTDSWILFNGVEVVSPYEVKQTGINTNVSYVDVKLVPNTEYTLSWDYTGASAIAVYKMSKINTSDGSLVGYTSAKSFTFTTDNRENFRVFIRPNSSSTVNITVKDIMLTCGHEVKTFSPMNNSFFTASVQLGQVGASRDMLYKQNGLWMMSKRVNKNVVLDGELNWLFGSNKLGFKRFSYVKPSNMESSTNSILIKYNGFKLKYDSLDGSPDTYNIGNHVNVNVNNSNTGFSENYTPTASEIKAYFNGWQIKTSDGAGKPTAWKSIINGSDAPTQTLDYVSKNQAPNYTPYQLSYTLNKPEVINVNDKVEGDIILNGLTQVEVGTDVIVREEVIPKLDGSSYYIMDRDSSSFWGASRVKHNAKEYLNIYKNGEIDSMWYSISPTGMKIDSKYFDTTAVYSVTYIVKDSSEFTTNVTDLKLTYSNSIKLALEDIVTKQSNTDTQVSVNVRAIAELYKRVRILEGGF